MKIIMENSKTINKYKKQLMQAYAAFITVLDLGFVAAIIINNNFISDPKPIIDKIFAYFVPAFFIITTIVAYLLFTTQLKSVKKEGSLANKLEKYRQLYITKLSIFNGTGLFAILAYLVTSNILHIIVLGLILLLFVLNRFSISTLGKKLELSQDEINTINNDDSDITPTLNQSFIQKNPWVIIILVLFCLYIIYDNLKGLI
jgi:hypothetical protein